MSTDMQAILDDLVKRVPGSRGAILLDSDGLLIAQAAPGTPLNLEALGALASPLLQEAQAAAGRHGRGPVSEVLLESERATLAMIPLKNACSLCLVLSPEAVPGRGLFEARRAAAALDQAL